MTVLPAFLEPRIAGPPMEGHPEWLGHPAFRPSPEILFLIQSLHGGNGKETSCDF